MAGKLRAKQIGRLRPGRHGDGGTLFLVVEAPPSGSRHWVQRLTVNGRRRDIGLGGWPFVGLAEARDRAFVNRQAARRGGDPVPRAATVPTFRQAAAKVEAATHWAGRTAESRRVAFATYCAAILDRRVDQVDRRATLAILAPIWIEKAATARRLRGWLRGVLAWAQAHGHVEVNYAGEAIDGGLPTNGKATREHRPALRYQDVPGALERIAASTAAPSVRACLRFIALTAVRSGEARLMVWSEVDLTAREWKIPASRMKAGREHRVPLSDQAVEVLVTMQPGAGLVFPARVGKPISPSTLLKAFHAATGTKASVHGLRSSFRVWCAEAANTTRDLAEQCLAHVVGSEIERSYQRGDLFDHRRRLMADWAAFCGAGHHSAPAPSGT